MTQEQTDRAYAMVESWSTDKERLSVMLAANMQPAEFAEICGYLADAFASVGDECVSMERSMRDCFTAMSMIRGIVFERVMLPIAEHLAKTDHDERLFALGWPRICSQLNSRKSAGTWQMHSRMNASTTSCAAVRAAKNFHRWGAHAATTYASKRGVSLNLLCMALGFEQRRAKRNARSSK